MRTLIIMTFQVILDTRHVYRTLVFGEQVLKILWCFLLLIFVLGRIHFSWEPGVFAWTPYAALLVLLAFLIVSWSQAIAYQFTQTETNLYEDTIFFFPKVL